MSANKIAPALFFWMLIQVTHHLSLKGWDVLSIIKDRQPARRLMRRNSVEPFEHLEVIDPKSAQLEKMLRECGGPNAMRMKNRACTTSRGGRAMQQRLGATLGLVRWRDLAMLVDNNEVIRAKVSFVFTAGGDQKSQWIAIDDNTVITGRTQ